MTKFQEELKSKMHLFVKLVYKLTKQFPKDELYGVTSQLRRASLSVILNYIEGFARFKSGTQLNFYETSYGSLKESKYLLFFSETENYITKREYEESFKLGEEISKMLWNEIQRIKKP